MYHCHRVYTQLQLNKYIISKNPIQLNSEQRQWTQNSATVKDKEWGSEKYISLVNRLLNQPRQIVVPVYYNDTLLKEQGGLKVISLGHCFSNLGLRPVTCPWEVLPDRRCYSLRLFICFIFQKSSGFSATSFIFLASSEFSAKDKVAIHTAAHGRNITPGNLGSIRYWVLIVYNMWYWLFCNFVYRELPWVLYVI